MQRLIISTVVLSVLVQAGVAGADGADPTIPVREVAERAAREAVLEAAAEGVALLQASQPQRRRSVGRTVGGIILMGVGAPLLIVGLASEDAGGSVCVGGDCITVDVDTGGAGYGIAALGGAMVVSGALLATVWSDVPVVNNLDFTVSPRRVQVGKTFGF